MSHILIPEFFISSHTTTGPLLHLATAAAAQVAPDDDVVARGERVAEAADVLAGALGWGGRRRELLVEVALRHDVGTALISREILTKPGRLTAVEFAEVQRHVVLGAHLLEGDLNIQQLGWVLHHHERWDGRGYPDRLTGDQVPAGARIIAVADAWDAMTTERCYRKPLSVSATVAELWRCAGTQFDPEVVKALTRVVTPRRRRRV